MVMVEQEEEEGGKMEWDAHLFVLSSLQSLEPSPSVQLRAVAPDGDCHSVAAVDLTSADND